MPHDVSVATVQFLDVKSHRYPPNTGPQYKLLSHLNGHKCGYLCRYPHYDDREARGGPPIAMPGFAGGWFLARSPQRILFGGELGLKAYSTPFAYGLEAWINLQLRLSRLELASFRVSEHLSKAPE